MIDLFIYILNCIHTHLFDPICLHLQDTEREREGGRGANTIIDRTINTKVAVDFPFSFEQTIEIQIETNRWIK